MEVKLAYVMQVCALEDLSGMAALRRAWDITREAFWRTLGFLLVFGLAAGAAQQVVSVAGQAIMSVADQYLVNGGGSYAWPHSGVSVAGSLRLEGVPARDLIGSSNGFRRPGYAVSIAPSASYSRGKNSFTLGVPIAVYRNRTVSVSDEEVGGHGDAAFADYLILAGYSRSF